MRKRQHAGSGCGLAWLPSDPSIGFWRYDAKQKETQIDMEGLKAMGVVSVKPEFNYNDVC